jgi:hypothetical protein
VHAPEVEQIIALAAQVKDLKLQLQDRRKDADGSNAKRSKKPDSKGHSHSDAGENPRKVPAWQKEYTTDTMVRPNEKTGESTTYHSCPHHGRYTVHKLSVCQIQGIAADVALRAPAVPRPARTRATNFLSSLALLAAEDYDYDQAQEWLAHRALRFMADLLLLLVDTSIFVFHWLIPDFGCLTSLTVALPTLVWISTQNLDNDRLRGSYVPKRLRTSSQFIEWIIKSRTKAIIFEKIEAAIYSLQVSRTRADRLRRRRPRHLPRIYFLLSPRWPYRGAYFPLQSRLSLMDTHLPSWRDRSRRAASPPPITFEQRRASPPLSTLFLAPFLTFDLFDSNSILIIANPGATRSFTPCMDHFAEPLMDLDKSLRPLPSFLHSLARDLYINRL